jgi:hypothetical protein
VNATPFSVSSIATVVDKAADERIHNILLWSGSMNATIILTMVTPSKSFVLGALDTTLVERLQI